VRLPLYVNESPDEVGRLESVSVEDQEAIVGACPVCLDPTHLLISQSYSEAEGLVVVPFCVDCGTVWEAEVVHHTNIKRLKGGTS